MKILLVYPKYPDTFWSFKHALKFASKKAVSPPLGLLTVAAMLPMDWEKKLVDMNVTELTNDIIRWADYVFISAMTVQKESVKEVITRCTKLGVKIVAGGPLFNTEYKEFQGVHHFVLGEAEATLQPFLEDLDKGLAQHIYDSNEYPDISKTPIPLWSLINMKQYATMNLQYSRGCPYDCEFCDVIILNGHKPRTKSKAQLIKEMDVLYENGWRGSLFIVDDNFIGNKTKLKADILPALIQWRSSKKYPFALYTEASINLADDDELIRLMIAAGFDVVFIGIETPNENSLVECTKTQNQNRDLAASVKKLQKFGLEVQGGFIIGFDSDPESIFHSQIDFIQMSGIVTAMVGLLNAPSGTRLYQRLKGEGRLLNSFNGNNTDFSLNFVPKMGYDRLIQGYKDILKSIYSPKQYYERIKTFLGEYQPPRTTPGKIHLHHIQAFFRAIWFLGICGKGKRYYWKLFTLYSLQSIPKLARFIFLSIYGYHFRKLAETYTKE
ncbi:B12-binding domain-containing radical SAM protein [Chloroflexota bacterium]